MRRVSFDLWVHIHDEDTGKSLNREAEYPDIWMTEVQANSIFRDVIRYMDRNLEAYLDGDDDGNRLMAD